MLLAVDTATRLAGLALYDVAGGQVLAEEVWHTAFNHTVELMPRLVRMMAQQSLGPDDLTGVAVSLGPGSFTGLRIGLSLAKGLALSRKSLADVYLPDAAPVDGEQSLEVGTEPDQERPARELPVVGIPTLDVVAHPHMVRRMPIMAVIEAGRGRICVGRYVPRRGGWRRQGRYRLTTLESLCEEVEGAALFCGELTAHDAATIRRCLGDAAVVASPASSLRRASYLAELGWQRLARGDADDLATLSPIYLHNPQIDG